MRIAYFVTPECSQDHAGTGRPGTRRGHLGALDGVSRPSRLPAPRSQHIGTQRPARKMQRPGAKMLGHSQCELYQWPGSVEPGLTTRLNCPLAARVRTKVGSQGVEIRPGHTVPATAPTLARTGKPPKTHAIPNEAPTEEAGPGCPQKAFSRGLVGKA